MRTETIVCAAAVLAVLYTATAMEITFKYGTDSHLSPHGEAGIISGSAILAALAVGLAVNQAYQATANTTPIRNQLSNNEQNSLWGMLFAFVWQLGALLIAAEAGANAKQAALAIVGTDIAAFSLPWLLRYCLDLQDNSGSLSLSNNETTAFYAALAGLDGSVLGAVIGKAVAGRIGILIGAPVGTVTAALTTAGIIRYHQDAVPEGYNILPTTVAGSNAAAGTSNSSH